MSSFIANILRNEDFVTTSEPKPMSNIHVIDIDTANQMGGNNKNTEKSIKHNDNNLNINKLLSMLTSTTSNNSENIETIYNKTLTGGNDSMTSIDTQLLEDKLMNLLEKNSNNLDTNKLDNSYNNLFTPQNGGNNNISILDVKSFFKDLKSKGINVDVKLNNQTFSEFFDMAATTTDINNTVSAVNKKQMGGKQMDTIMSATSTENILNNKIISTYTDDINSVTSTAHIDTILQQGGKGPNPGFEAFLALKKHIAKKLNMPNGPAAGKIAGAVQRDAKSKFPNHDSLEISTEAIKMFDKNMETYQKQALEYKSDTPKKKSKKSSKKSKKSS
jgi:hypothetical protein